MNTSTSDVARAIETCLDGALSQVVDRLCGFLPLWRSDVTPTPQMDPLPYQHFREPHATDALQTFAFCSIQQIKKKNGKNAGMLFLLIGVLAQNPWLPWPVPLWNCPVLPPAPPATNATQLRPGNIKVVRSLTLARGSVLTCDMQVMALGDSISAGFAMKGFPPSDFLGFVSLLSSLCR
jgi:hypothetical protein